MREKDEKGAKRGGSMQTAAPPPLLLAGESIDTFQPPSTRTMETKSTGAGQREGGLLPPAGENIDAVGKIRGWCIKPEGGYIGAVGGAKGKRVEIRQWWVGLFIGRILKGDL